MYLQLWPWPNDTLLPAGPITTLFVCNVKLPVIYFGTPVLHLPLGDRDTFRHREFSFTLEDDVYVRYQSFDSQESLEEGVRKAMPYKMDIGAIFSVRVRMTTCIVLLFAYIVKKVDILRNHPIWLFQ